MQVRAPAVRRTLAVSVLAVVLTSACNDDGRELREPEFPLPATTTLAPATTPDGELVTSPPTTPAAALQLFAPWQNGATIPIRYTCDDADLAPPLTWTGTPADAVEVAITVTDLDAGFTHWIMFGIDPTRTGLAEGEIPTGAIQWTNDFARPGWGGPCPPVDDDPHTYLFTVHALNQQVEVADDAGAAEVISFLNQTAIAQSSVSGTYARAG